MALSEEALAMIDRLVEEAPPLTVEQADHLVRILRPTRRVGFTCRDM